MRFVERLGYGDKPSIPAEVKLIAEIDGIDPALLMLKDSDGEPLFYRVTPENHPNLLRIHEQTVEALEIDKRCPIYLCRSAEYDHTIMSSVGAMANKSIGTTIYYKPFIDTLSDEEFGALHAHELKHSKQSNPEDSLITKALYLSVASAFCAVGIHAVSITTISAIAIGVASMAAGISTAYLTEARLRRSNEFDSDNAAMNVWGGGAAIALLEKSESFIENLPNDETTKLAIAERLFSSLRPFVPQPIKLLVNSSYDMWSDLASSHPDTPKRIAAILKGENFSGLQR